MMCRRLSAASESEGAHISARIQIRFIRQQSLVQLDNTNIIGHWTTQCTHCVDKLNDPFADYKHFLYNFIHEFCANYEKRKEIHDAQTHLLVKLN